MVVNKTLTTTYYFCTNTKQNYVLNCRRDKNCFRAYRPF